MIQSNEIEIVAKGPEVRILNLNFGTNEYVGFIKFKLQHYINAPSNQFPNILFIPE